MELNNDINNFRILEYMKDFVGAFDNILIGKIDNNNVYIEKNGERAYAKFNGNIFEYKIESNSIELGRKLESMILFCQREVLFFSSGIICECMDMLRTLFRVLNIIMIAIAIICAFVDEDGGYINYLVIIAVIINFVESYYFFKLLNDAKRIEKVGHEKGHYGMGRCRPEYEEPMEG